MTKKSASHTEFYASTDLKGGILQVINTVRMYELNTQRV